MVSMSRVPQVLSRGRSFNLRPIVLVHSGVVLVLEAGSCLEGVWRLSG